MDFSVDLSVEIGTCVDGTSVNGVDRSSDEDENVDLRIFVVVCFCVIVVVS